MEFKDIKYEVKRPHVATITLNRPEIDNATTGDSFVEIMTAFHEADRIHRLVLLY